MQKIASTIDPLEFFRTFYDKLSDILDPKCIPDIILILGEGNYKVVNCLDKEIQLIATLVEISKTAIWR